MMNRNIWNNKYTEGIVNIKGSLFDYTTRWVWDIINHYAEDDIKKECIDIGCGDLSFWKYYMFFYRKCENYIGIDISDIIIRKNNNKFKKKINRIFWRRSSGLFMKNLSSKVVLCIDLLFHLMDDDTYINTIINLCNYSRKWIMITNWHKEPNNYNKSYQKYRDFNKYQYIFEENGFILIKSYKVPSNDIGSIYVYKKVECNEC